MCFRLEYEMMLSGSVVALLQGTFREARASWLWMIVVTTQSAGLVRVRALQTSIPVQRWRLLSSSERLRYLRHSFLVADGLMEAPDY